MPPKPLKVAAVIQGIEETNGNLAAVARRFGVKRQAVWEYVQRHPSCKTAYEEQRQTMVDSAESVLYRKVLAGEDTTALIFFLKTQGKARGYSERTEVTGKDGGPVETSGKQEHHFDLAAYSDLWRTVFGGDGGGDAPQGDDPR